MTLKHQSIPWPPAWTRKACPWCDAPGEVYCVGPRGQTLCWPHAERVALSPQAKRDYLSEIKVAPLPLGRGVHRKLSALDKLTAAADAGRGLVLRPSEVLELRAGGH